MMILRTPTFLGPIKELYENWTSKYDPWKGHRDSEFVVFIEDESLIFVAVAEYRIINDNVWGKRWVLVENVFVLPSRRQQGLGTQLMSEIETIAKEKKCDYIKLTSRKPQAQDFYRALGYEEGSSFYKALPGRSLD